MPRARPERVARRRPPAGLLAGLLLAGLLVPCPIGVAPPHAQEQPLARADLATEIRDRLRRIRQELIETARDAQSNEAVVGQSETRLAALKAHHASRAGDLSGLRGRLANLTTAMQRLARRPPEAVLTSPRPPLETARAMMLVQFMVPSIRREADEIRGELTKIEALNHQLQTEQERFRAANVALEAQRDQLDLLIERKNALWRDLNNKTTPTDQLEQSATSLSALFAALKQHGNARAEAAERLAALLKDGPSTLATSRSAPQPAVPPLPETRPPGNQTTRPSEQSTVAPSVASAPTIITPVPSTGSFAANKGRLTFPAIGRLVARFGETDSLGLTTKGITLRTRANAPVVAVHDGKVIYAGPFRGYGRIIIIEHGQGFLTLLAGLDRIDIQAGQTVLAGEPVGTMHGPAGKDNARSRRLYIELRRNGAPVDPLAWLSTQRDTAIQ